MNDAFERRALLHLGRRLQLLARVLEARSTAATVGQLVELNPILEDETLLEHVSSERRRLRPARPICNRKRATEMRIHLLPAAPLHRID